MRVALVNMPFAALDRPALGLSLLEGALRAAGHECDVLYRNLSFATVIGRETYERLAIAEPEMVMAGDAVFRRALRGDADDDGLERMLAVDWGMRAHNIEAVVLAAPRGARLHPPLSRRRGLVALRARRLHLDLRAEHGGARLGTPDQDRYPGVLTVFGGPNWDGDMGRALFARYGFVDAVCLGEADRSFPELVECVARGDAARIAVIKGVLFRAGGRVSDTGSPEPILDLDTLPVPDHGDYFASLEAAGPDRLP